MSSRTQSNRGPGSGSKRFNSLTFGYGEQPTMAPKQEWWTDERIQGTVTRGFILTKLTLEERDQLFNPISFDGLTDDTYLDWILNKARRLFLILDTIGLPGKIFSVLNASWDDDDLPLSRDDVRGLKLSEKNDDKLNSRFFTFQHSFCLRETKRNTHINYSDDELVPIEFISKAPPAAPIPGWECCRPVSKKKTFVRRRFSLGDGSYQLSEEEFLDNANRAKEIDHDHIANIWASYVWRGSGYIMTGFVGEHSMKSFMESKTPQQFQKLSKVERTTKLLEWINCLSHAIKALHDRGWPHTEIRPSNILIDAENNVAFSDIGSLSMFQTDKKRDDQEVYNYSPPENFSSTVPVPSTSHHRESKISTTSSSGSSSYSNRSSSSVDFLRGLTQRSHLPPSPPLSDISEGSASGSPTDNRDIHTLRSPEKADIFSLGCIFLDILTYLMEGKLTGFIKRRSSKRKSSLSMPSSNITSAPSVKSNSSKTDTSFHANLIKIEAWIKNLTDESCEYDDTVYRGVPRLLKHVRSMLSQNPQLRPSAQQLCEQVSDALKVHSGIISPHCIVSMVREEPEEDKKRQQGAGSVLSQRQPTLNATNLFRLRNASSAGVQLRTQDSASFSFSRDAAPSSIPPSPPASESPISPVSPDDFSIASEQIPSTFSHAHQIGPISPPPTSSPSRSVSRHLPTSVHDNSVAYSTVLREDNPGKARRTPFSTQTSTSFFSSSPDSMIQQPGLRSESPVSATSTDPLGIVHEYSDVEYPIDPYASPAVGPPSNYIPRLDMATHPMSRAVTAPAAGFNRPRDLHRAPSTTSTTSAMSVPVALAPSSGPTTVPSSHPLSSLSPTLTWTPTWTWTPAPMPSYSSMPIRQMPKRGPSPAPTGPLPKPPSAPAGAGYYTPTGTPPPNTTIPPRKSSTRAPVTAPLPPPTSALPPIPVPPPTTALPQVPPQAPAQRHRTQLAAPYVFYPVTSSTLKATSPSFHPPLVQTRSAPEAIPQSPGKSQASSGEAPQIPPKSPRRRGVNHTRVGSDLLLDDALNVWKGAAKTPEQIQRAQFRPETEHGMAERVDFDLSTLSGVNLGAESWRDYYVGA